jgi:hypothetical protein
MMAPLRSIVSTSSAASASGVLLKSRAASVSHARARPRPFQRVYDDRLATLPGVQRLSSTLVMKTVVENRPLLL